MKKATLDQGFDLLKRVKEAEVSCGDLQTIFDSGVLTDIFDAVKSGKTIDREAVRKALQLEPFLPTYSIVVDYSLSLAQMIEAGDYNWINDDITATNFPIQGEGKQQLELVLFHFDRYIQSDDAIKEIDKAGYRPATLPELLGLGAQHQGLQRQFPVVALGIKYKDYIGVGLECDPNRDLRLISKEVFLNPCCHFAVTRKGKG